MQLPMSAYHEALVDLVNAVDGAAHRRCADIPCYCRAPQPNPELGHEDRCKRLYRAYKAASAVVESGDN